MKDVMLDLETLGTKSDAAIIQIGACYFDRNTGEIGETISMNVRSGDLCSQFSFEDTTIRWWLNQSPEARAAVAGDDSMHIREALQQLSSFLWSSDLLLWSHATFDMPILMHAFDVVARRFPTPFRQLRDIRTLMDLSPSELKEDREGVHHNALDDAKYQARYVSQAIQRLSHGAA